jgi:DNA-binding NarL/FixJ family response regulator
MPKKTRIVIAENHTLTRKGYISLLNEHGNMQVIGEAANGKELIKILEKSQPDIVLLDLEMPVMNGKDALKVIKTRFQNVKVIVLSFHAQEHVIVEVIKLGANAYIIKDSSYEDFIDTILTVKRDGFFYPNTISKALVGELTRKTGSIETDKKLTERETEILILTCDGRTMKEMALQLSVSIKTIDFHKGNIYKKLGVTTVSGLYIIAEREG